MSGTCSEICMFDPYFGLVLCFNPRSLLLLGNLEWLDKNKTSFLIMWKRPEEWGKLIYQWVRAQGLHTHTRLCP